jgi:hypothetical protein
MDWAQLDTKAELVEKALKIDDRYADAHFLLAKIHDETGKPSEAKSEYIRAKDEDVCPLRMLERMHNITLRVANQTGTPLLDIRRAFEAGSKDGIPGDDLLIDHVHPRIDGHQLIALELLEEMTRQGFLTPRPGWRDEQRSLYTKHWKTLPANYFPESVARLRGLRRWSQGRSSRLKPDAK